MTALSAKGFNLMELLVVLVIVAILVALSIPNYSKTRERAHDKEAQAALSLVQAAEKMYRLRVDRYYPVNGTVETDISDINTDLNLDLAEQKWDYSVTTPAGAATFIANATIGTRTWSIDQDDSKATCSGC